VNRPWKKEQSLWELVLVPGQKSYLFYRMHHLMADGKSIIKVLVEGLGQKKSQMDKANYIQKSKLEPLLFPINYMKMIFLAKDIAEESAGSKWNVFNYYKPGSTPKTFVALCSPISMSKLKTVAKKNRTYPSSVIMSIISGAVATLHGNSFKGDDLYLLMFYQNQTTLQT